MLKKISIAQAKLLFQRARIIYAVPGGMSAEDLSATRMRMEKTRQAWKWPEESIARFKESYKARGIDFYAAPEDVLVKRNGHAGFIITLLQRTGQLQYRGTDKGLIRFLNQNLFHLVNSGYLDPSCRGNLQY